MLIPLGTDRPQSRKPVVTHALIALNVGVFVAMALLGSSNPDLTEQIQSWGAVGRDFPIPGGYLHQFGLWQLLTSAFLHGGFMHLFGNMIFLLVFGPSVEDRFGSIGFALFYIAGAVMSALVHMAADPMPAIGASGAVAAVSGAFLILFPRTRIRCFVFFIVIGAFMIPSWWLIGLYIVLDLVSHMFKPENGIANAAHLGGYGFGMGLAFMLLATGLLKRETYDMFSILKQRQRRKAFASAHKMHEQGMERVLRDAKSMPEPDPKTQRLAEERAEIGRLLGSGKHDEAADLYVKMIDEFGHDEHAPLTLHRDGQYQVANALYQRGDRVEAADAFERLVSSYPADPERHIIGVLIARTRAEEQGDVPGAIAMLEELLDQSLDDDTKALVGEELDRIRSDRSQGEGA